MSFTGSEIRAPRPNVALLLRPDPGFSCGVCSPGREELPLPPTSVRGRVLALMMWESPLVSGAVFAAGLALWVLVFWFDFTAVHLACRVVQIGCVAALVNQWVTGQPLSMFHSPQAGADAVHRVVGGAAARLVSLATRVLCLGEPRLTLRALLASAAAVLADRHLSYGVLTLVLWMGGFLGPLVVDRNWQHIEPVYDRAAENTAVNGAARLAGLAPLRPHRTPTTPGLRPRADHTAVKID
eukprot:TRINITY_DN61612_c0_g1_i1.p1 TRINITY_DN61612_c0_g1~~TRINITY_DN61612_c0_g1_i1.p1  ORF type:complete len:240 (+),score=48.69 TRINITY_DN61612_c0_g1_i1:110-829(+)